MQIDWRRELKRRVSLWALDAPEGFMMMRLSCDKRCFADDKNGMRCDCAEDAAVQAAAADVWRGLPKEDGGVMRRIYEWFVSSYYAAVIDASDVDVFRRGSDAMWRHDAAGADVLGEHAAAAAVLLLTHMWCEVLTPEAYVAHLRQIVAVVESFTYVAVEVEAAASTSQEEEVATQAALQDVLTGESEALRPLARYKAVVVVDESFADDCDDEEPEDVGDCDQSVLSATLDGTYGGMFCLSDYDHLSSTFDHAEAAGVAHAYLRSLKPDAVVPPPVMKRLLETVTSRTHGVVSPPPALLPRARSPLPMSPTPEVAAGAGGRLIWSNGAAQLPPRNTVLAELHRCGQI
jgi:hypothetical protein